jgi:triosephosphate isomerase (TIM)
MKLIIANWKMNPETAEEAAQLTKAIDAPNLIIAPPFPFLEIVGDTLKQGSLGAQDVFIEEKGAFTGEVSASQLASLNVKQVIVGHSERRRFGETDEMIAQKIIVLLAHKMTPILCVGEKREERARGISEKVISSQLQKGLQNVKIENADIIIAYEPVWAISTAKNAEPDSPENASIMIEILQKAFPTTGHALHPIFIYGGSVNEVNAEQFLKEKVIEGALVGGASLHDKKIKTIIDLAKKY